MTKAKSKPQAEEPIFGEEVIKVAAKMGRPSSYNQELGNLICECIALGMSVRRICDSEGMPDETTVYRWLNVHDDFRLSYARARVVQAQTYFDEIGDIARKATAETAQVARVQIDALKWQAAKLSPKQFGDRVELAHEGEVGLSVTNYSVRDRAKAMAALVARQRG
jgi:hypothetical protein